MPSRSSSSSRTAPAWPFGWPCWWLCSCWFGWCCWWWLWLRLLFESEWVDTDDSVGPGRWEVAVVNEEYTDAVSSSPY